MQKRRLAIADISIAHFYQRRAHIGRLIKAKRERIVRHHRRQLCHALKLLDAALRLFGFTGLGTETTNKVVQMGFGRLLLLKRLLLLRHTLVTGTDKLLIITRIKGDFLLFDVQDMTDGGVQKRLVMRDNNHQTGISINPSLKPKNGIQIQMVGWLIKEH